MSSVANSNPTASSSTGERTRRPSGTSRTLNSVDKRQSTLSPAQLGAALIKHGKYVAAGAAGIWWLDLDSAGRHVWEASDSWARRSLMTAVGLQGLTIVLFLYLTLFLPWFRGYVPNYPKWQQSRRLRIIFPLLTTSILVGWSCLVFALKNSSHPTPRGPLRDAIRGVLDISENLKEPGMGIWSSMAGATAVYTLMFGLLGLVPSPNAPVRTRKTQ